jgi:hypothetical protein
VEAINNGYLTTPSMGRRAALQRLGAVALGLCTAGCSRAFVLRTIYPEAGELDPSAMDALLAAFVTTIVPEVDTPDRVVRLMHDPALPFAPFSGALAVDLARRTRTHVGHAAFDQLDLERRTAIVAAGLEGGGIPGRIYNGAALFTQAAVYGGLASADGSCAITGFDGRFRFRGFAEQTYPDPETFLPAPVSADGNPW